MCSTINSDTLSEIDLEKARYSVLTTHMFARDNEINAYCFSSHYNFDISSFTLIGLYHNNASLGFSKHSFSFIVEQWLWHVGMLACRSIFHAFRFIIVLNSNRIK